MKEVNEETRTVHMVHVKTVLQPIFKYEDVSTWKRLLGMTAYVVRFIHNVRAKSGRTSDKRKVGPLNPREIKITDEYWIKTAQSDLAKRIDKEELKTLSPFVDNKGIIRVGGRVDPSLDSLLCYDNSRPALLPYKHWISVPVTSAAHQSGHPGVATTTAKTRRKYWIIKGKGIKGHNVAN